MHHLLWLPILTSYRCHNDLTCFCSISINGNPFSILQSEKRGITQIAKEEMASNQQAMN
jgi:hypothetical protein